ncbi:MAG: Alpha/Beta hydrolase protein [Olpidium bornovanus]|uniref:Alpha/Beta hydrolase protein n=1 Tax=Olpidium bornovanus TaxID=278681 RepID=A0A8H7ZV87_9FUNG|nr:MAG: Alpha/Beta hydrolase protein [Olpidium bornovanus]
MHHCGVPPVLPAAARSAAAGVPSFRACGRLCRAAPSGKRQAVPRVSSGELRSTGRPAFVQFRPRRPAAAAKRPRQFSSSAPRPSVATGPEPSYQNVLSGYKIFHSQEPLLLDYGGVLPDFRIAYETWGKLNDRKDNAILLHTGLSASSHAKSHSQNTNEGWWEKFIGPNAALDTNKFHVICTNVIGSCYGSTGPSSVNPETSERYGTNFPIISIWDMVRAQFCLLDYLGVDSLLASVGASMGGMQVMESASPSAPIRFLAAHLPPNVARQRDAPPFTVHRASRTSHSLPPPCFRRGSENWSRFLVARGRTPIPLHYGMPKGKVGPVIGVTRDERAAGPTARFLAREPGRGI